MKLSLFVTFFVLPGKEEVRLSVWSDEENNFVLHPFEKVKEFENYFVVGMFASLEKELVLVLNKR